MPIWIRTLSMNSMHNTPSFIHVFSFRYPSATPCSAVTGNWTGVVSGAARFTTAGADVVVFTAPSSRTQRANMSVWVSRVSH